MHIGMNPTNPPSWLKKHLLGAGKNAGFRLLRIGILTLGLTFMLLLRKVQAVEPLIPLIDMGMGTYFGFEGGLYPNGMNALPPLHATEGLTRTLNIMPLDTNGFPDPNGKYILLSVGMSNANQEFCGNSIDGISCNSWTFMGQAAEDAQVEHDSMMIINGAKGGQVAYTWDSPNDANYDRIRDEILAPLGLSENQVQIVWAKMANANPDTSLPAGNADAYLLLNELGNIMRALKTRYPHLQQVFLSSRIYAGYATTTLNPEPYAYESGFSVKWLIGAQINQMNGGGIDPLADDLDYNTVAAWLAWGPYLWAEGLNPRSDGLIWELEDFEADGTHPSQQGETKAGALLLDFFLNSPYTSCWFRADQICTGEPTPTPTPTDTVTATASPTATVTPSETSSPTPTATVTSSPTLTNTPSPSNTPTSTHTLTPTSSDTPTSTLIPTNTGTPITTLTPTITASPNNRPTPTYTPSVTATPKFESKIFLPVILRD